MHRLFLLLVVTSLIYACSGDDNGSILTEFPITYKISEVNSLGVNTYYYTDTIIYKIESHQVDSIKKERDQIILETKYIDTALLQNFVLQSITFIDETSVRFGRLNAPQDTISRTAYTEVGGIGVTSLADPDAIGYKINPGLDMLLSCVTITSKRLIDTLFDGDFVAGIDTLIDEESNLEFQLKVTDSPQITVGSCVDYIELDHVTNFARDNGLVNNDRIVTHRTDLIFERQ